MDNLKNRIKDVIENTGIDLDYDGVEDITNALLKAIKQFESNKNETQHNVIEASYCDCKHTEQVGYVPVRRCEECGKLHIEQ